MGREILGVPRERPPRRSDAETVTSADREPGIDAAPAPATDGPSWVDNVKNSIPVEIVTAWAAINSVFLSTHPDAVPPRTYWVLFGAFCVATALHMWVDVETPTEERARRLGVPLAYLRHSQYAQIALAVGGFVVWAYFLQPPKSVRWYDPMLATVVLPTYVALGPQLVPNVLRKLHGVETDSGDDAGGDAASPRA